VRADSAGATHELLDFCRDGRLRYTVGFDLTEPVRTAILSLGEGAWTPALDADGRPRDNGQVAELTDQLDLSSWPERSRVIVRRERRHPGAQLSFTDHDGHRFQAMLTDQPDPNIAALERRHRARARVEDRIRAAKDCGLENLPFRDFDANAVWLELVCAPKTSSLPSRPSRSTASSPAASPSACAIGCCTPPDAWPSTPAKPRCASRAGGPGLASWPPPSPASRRRPRAETAAARPRRRLTPRTPASACPQPAARRAQRTPGDRHATTQSAPGPRSLTYDPPRAQPRPATTLPARSGLDARKRHQPRSNIRRRS
jgi:hypothetical protein